MYTDHHMLYPCARKKNVGKNIYGNILLGISAIFGTLRRYVGNKLDVTVPISRVYG